MKTFQLSLTAMLLLGLTTAAFAQNAPTPQQQRTMQREAQRNAMKKMFSSFWNGEGSNMMAIGLLQQDIFREGIGASKEQVQIIQDTMSNMGTLIQNDPSFKQFQDEITKVVQEYGSPFAENASEEAKQKFADIQTQMQAKSMEMMTKTMTNLINDNLTSDQLKKVKEFQISSMSEIPIISPSMFEALDLSDEQKKQLDEIKKEMEPEFDIMMDKMVDVQMKFSEAMDNALEGKLEGVTDPEERRRLRQEAEDAARKSNPESQRIQNELLESGKKLAENLKIKMFDVLTDEQWNRMVDLVDNPPEYAKKMVAQMREKFGVNDSKPETPGAWAPGPNSWKPGDPIPESYRQQRREGRFPRVNQSE